MSEAVYLAPRHICPTVNNFDHALLVSEGRTTGVERVTARGREVPMIIRLWLTARKVKVCDKTELPTKLIMFADSLVFKSSPVLTTEREPIVTVASLKTRPRPTCPDERLARLSLSPGI